MDSGLVSFIGTSTYQTIATTTGFDPYNMTQLWKTVTYQVFGTVLGEIYSLRWWIAVALVIGALVFFSTRAFRFFNI